MTEPQIESVAEIRGEEVISRSSAAPPMSKNGLDPAKDVI